MKSRAAKRQPKRFDIRPRAKHAHSTAHYNISAKTDSDFLNLFFATEMNWANGHWKSDADLCSSAKKQSKKFGNVKAFWETRTVRKKG